MNADAETPWLLLIHQLPPKPAYLRVKVWRRLQALGAVAVKNAVYALPAGEAALEDFQWLRRDIREAGGDATIAAARWVDGLSDAALRAEFDAARDADYAEIAAELRAALDALPAGPVDAGRAEAQSVAARAKRRLAEVAAIDFFGAGGRQAAEALLAALAAALAEPAAAGAPAAAAPPDLAGRVWVTRRGVGVDRMASAWLVRRFVDAGARFRFVAEKDYRPAPGELRFDMFEGEFTHEADRCTFEVLLAAIGRDDPALQAIGEVVHDLDLKDGKFGRAEAAGIRMLLDGIARDTDDDEERLARGARLFDDLYASYRRSRP
ncbi:MAG TPA: chromate resistance protein ChrB domain-containing protein [Alphaproteobacteria bacterium]|nr:chromate resistance protein ChrB domain-containing protein [Alphaproteobacteria bacterium]